MTPVTAEHLARMRERQERIAAASVVYMPTIPQRRQYESEQERSSSAHRTLNVSAHHFVSSLGLEADQHGDICAVCDMEVTHMLHVDVPESETASLPEAPDLPDEDFLDAERPDPVTQRHQHWVWHGQQKVPVFWKTGRPVTLAPLGPSNLRWTRRRVINGEVVTVWQWEEEGDHPPHDRNRMDQYRERDLIDALNRGDFEQAIRIIAYFPGSSKRASLAACLSNTYR